MIFALISLLALSAANEVKHVGYLVAFALVVAAGAAALGISSARRARIEETARPRGAIAGIVLGIISVALAGLALIGLIFSKQLTTYENCVNNAHSSAAQQTCTRQLLHNLEHR